MKANQHRGSSLRVRFGVAGAIAAALLGIGMEVQAETVTLVAALRGGQENPPVNSPGRGCGTFVIDTVANTLRFHISFGNLTSAETAAHIHGPAGPGVNAGVLFPLPSGNPKVGVWTYPEALESEILAGRTYVNIHTQNFGGGEIRGQINSFAADLDGAQENPATGVPSQGWATFNINTCNNTLNYYIAVESLSAAETAAHIHGMALPGTNAGIVFGLPLGPIKTGTWVYPEAMERQILDGMTYVNVHTAAFGGGEIRGQIVRTVVPIDASQETPPVPNPSGFGCGFIAFNRPSFTMGYYIGYAGLTGPETASHIHGFTPPGGAAGVLTALPPGTPKKGTWAYGPANEANVLGDLTYINIHTAAFGGGEIRGQIVVPLDRCVADANCDGTVNVNDLLIVINAWGACPAPPGLCPADTNYSGDVNVNDLLTIINGWGNCP